MRAMVLDAPQPAEQSPLQLRDVPPPVPGPGEVRLRVRWCGVCRTDLHIVEGDLKLPKLPVIPGHQIVGVVDALGAPVREPPRQPLRLRSEQASEGRRGAPSAPSSTSLPAPSFRVGERVGVPWLYSTDGRCPYCARGQENLCENGRFTGYHVDGGYAEAVVVPEQFAYSIPPQFSDEHAAPLLCAGVIGYRAFRLSGVRPGERLGLYGFGGSAHIVLQMARHLGCEVYVFTRGTSHRELAKNLGAVWAGTAEAAPPVLMDASIIFAPAGALVPVALARVRKGGTVSLAGITMSQIPAMDYEVLYHERVLRSAANSTRDDVRECLRLAAEVPVRTEITRFPLQQANEALQALKQSRIEGAAVLAVGH